MNVAIIGNGENKFNQFTRSRAFKIIRRILADHPGATIVSGHSPVGGIDIWAEEMARNLRYETMMFAPEQHEWDTPYGFKARNMDIARNSDIIYVIVVRKYPPGYRGRIFKLCYHCENYSDHDYKDHIKSGACWTGWRGVEMGKDVRWIVI